MASSKSGPNQRSILKSRFESIPTYDKLVFQPFGDHKNPVPQ